MKEGPRIKVRSYIIEKIRYRLWRLPIIQLDHNATERSGDEDRNHMLSVKW